jgi:hypothetical protein
MEKPINFLTASGGDLFDYFYSLQTHYATSYRAIAILRDEIAAAVEAKVRGECAEDIEAIRCKYDDAVADFLHAKARAERAEADANEVREAFKRVSTEMDRAERRQREMGEHGKRWEERARKAEAALADAKREGAYEALTKFEERVGWYPGCLATLGNIRAFRDSLYAPTPARSVMPVQLPVVNVSDFYDAPAVIIRPEQARAIVALAQEAR